MNEREMAYKVAGVLRMDWDDVGLFVDVLSDSIRAYWNMTEDEQSITVVNLTSYALRAAAEHGHKAKEVLDEFEKMLTGEAIE